MTETLKKAWKQWKQMRAEAHELDNAARELHAEADKLHDAAHKLYDEYDKLADAANTLYDDAYVIWEAVVEGIGKDTEVEWTDDGCIVNGELYRD